MFSSQLSSRHPDQLDYMELLREAGRPPEGATRIVRLAILADCAAQFLTPILRALFARRGIDLQVYEATFDAIEIEVVDSNSQLYQFKPHYVAIVMATQRLRVAIEGSASRDGVADATTARIVDLWSRIAAQSGARIVQATFVRPLERAFGNYELTVPNSVGSIVEHVNRGIVSAARQARNVLVCDADFVAAEIGRRQWFDDRLWVLSKALCSFAALPRFAQALSDVIAAAEGSVVKCVALDLDGTLWGGVIGDDGLEEIRLGDFEDGEAFVEFQRFLLELKNRGIILAVVSKNDRHHALLPFHQHADMILKEKDIAVFVANWDNKADNLRLVQQTLNIGFDSIVFLDDNPFERGLVREFLPEVIVPELPEDPALYKSALADLGLFETVSVSAADQTRTDQYREEATRRLAQNEFTDIGQYLLSLEMKATALRFSRDRLQRIAQLTQRSNQFNLTTRRYSLADCETLMSDRGRIAITLSLKDRFGDSGLIAIIVLAISDLVSIEQFLMSCRVLKRGVEALAMNLIVETARRHGLSTVSGLYLPTAKNAMVRDFYAGFGFVAVDQAPGGATRWQLNVDGYVPQRHHISIAASDV